MSDRLAELVRQRALVQEHLAWLEREIATAVSSTSSPREAGAASSATVPPIPAIPTLPSLPANPMPPASSAALPSTVGSAIPTAAAAAETPALPADAERILAQYRVAPTAVKEDVRKGCFLYFAAALLILGLGVALLYFAIGSR